ncbi:MAG: threonine synthase [Gammaproteobacteria bacterium]|nr:threonine synthase [Gammaproteobacteria bacterium]
MQYVSTRGGVKPVSFEQALLEGQAEDGGLYLPARYPQLTERWESFRDLSFTELAYEIVSLYATDIDSLILRAILDEAFSTFDDDDIVPLVKIDDLHVLELFHGPTLAFKDVALQVLGRLFEHTLNTRNQVLNILGATSGDTGSAAIAGVQGRDGIGIFIMFPDGRTSRLQELQMTTVRERNVHCLAIDGSFDDCQRILKSIFNDIEFKRSASLGAVNSINWARIMVQIVYYVYATLRYNEPVTFSVPTGNFGNILSAILAMQMGAPIRRLILGTNENDILARFFVSGEYKRGAVQQTLSPSMDIQVASNLERFIYLYLDGDSERLVQFMQEFAEKNHAVLHRNGHVDTTIDAHRVDTDETLKTIRDTWERFGYLVDPHTAVGVAAAAHARSDGPVICLATAHPAKFPNAVNEAIGKSLARHPRLDALYEKQARKVKLPADQEKVRSYLEANVIS